MSEWYEAKDGGIKLDKDLAEVNIWVTSNDFGNVYVTLTYKQVLMLADKIKSLTSDHE